MNVPPKPKRIKLVLYRSAGRFLFLRIKRTCRQCDLAYLLLQRIVDEVFPGRPVDLEIKPWLNHWWKLIGRGGWHPPILTVNRCVFSQGKVPDAQELIHRISHLLGRAPSPDQTRPFVVQPTPAAPPTTGPILYFSPACPHCQRLKSYLDAHAIKYALKDVTKSEAARNEIRQLTGRTTIPVFKSNDTVLVGFDIEQLQNCLAISPQDDRWQERTDQQPLPGPDPSIIAQVAQNARGVLESNWREDRTIPSSELYPHQWNWDSGFAARGYLHFRPERAYAELRSLFQGQWADGFLPHIIFNPDRLDHFPGPDYWHSDYSPQAPRATATSGISQPPIHASMIVDAAQIDPDPERALGFLRGLYPRLKNLHDFYFQQRDPHDEGLVAIVHPWESGLDNTPIWDRPLSRLETISPWAQHMQQRFNQLAEQGQRPQRPYIGLYSQLVEDLYRRKYDWRQIGRHHQFLVQDVLFNTLLCRAERDLAGIARAIGQNHQIHSARSDRLAQAMNRKLWQEDAGLYYDFDLVAQEPIRRDTVFSYLPLYAMICSPAQVGKLMDSLRTHCFCVSDRHCVGIPSYDMCQSDYQGEYYWRGPVWVNINWFLAAGLRHYAQEELADWIETSLLQLVHQHGFHEYYEPETGRGLGAPNFSWTAALVIDIAARFQHGPNPNHQAPHSR